MEKNRCRKSTWTSIRLFFFFLFFFLFDRLSHYPSVHLLIIINIISKKTQDNEALYHNNLIIILFRRTSCRTLVSLSIIDTYSICRLCQLLLFSSLLFSFLWLFPAESFWSHAFGKNFAVVSATIFWSNTSSSAVECLWIFFFFFFFFFFFIRTSHFFCSVFIFFCVRVCVTSIWEE